MTSPYHKFPSKGDRARKVEISGAGADLPTIGGNNLFTGEVAEMKNDTVGILVKDQHAWEDAWKALGKEPPAPLPKQSWAVVEAVKKALHPKGVSIAFEPEKIEIKPDNDVHINWKVLAAAHDEDANANSRYAVLLLPPKGKLKPTFNKVWPYQDEKLYRKQLKESLEAITRGHEKPLQAPPAATFKKGHRPRGQAMRK